MPTILPGVAADRDLIVADARARVETVRERIARAAAKSGRATEGIRLVAVSKTFPAMMVTEVARQGISDFGENRVQEAAVKIPEVERILGAEAAPNWHLVGHLQSNKARQAAALFDAIQSVHDGDLAERLDREAAKAGKRLRILIQVNVAAEASKSGAAPEDLPSLVDDAAGRPGLELRGLMTIQPYDPDPERSRRYFASLRELGEKVRTRLAPAPYAGELSMGMSEDFEVAIEEGATIVRIGRALFGERRTGR